MQEKAKYKIADIFSITGRGLVFAGYITDGEIFIGDEIEFTVFNKIRKRKITGIEGIRTSQLNPVNTGLLIKCENDLEIEEFHNWKPENQIALIYSQSIK